MRGGAGRMVSKSLWRREGRFSKLPDFMAARRRSIFSVFCAHFERSREAYIWAVFWLGSMWAGRAGHSELGRTVNFALRVGSGVNFSPKCSAYAVPPRMKNGTSAPSWAASARRSFWERPRSHRLFRPLSVAAASEDAPPRPEEIGMFFVISMWADLSML